MTSRPARSMSRMAVSAASSNISSRSPGPYSPASYAFTAANHQPGLPWEPTTVDGISGRSAIGEPSLLLLPLLLGLRLLGLPGGRRLLLVGLGGRGLARRGADCEDASDGFLEARWVERERVHARHEPSVTQTAPRASGGAADHPHRRRVPVDGVRPSRVDDLAALDHVEPG